MVAINHDKSLSLDEIRDFFVVNPNTGEVFWKERGMGRHRNKPAGCFVGPGYRKIGLRREGKYVQFYAHHIVWTYVNGEWPSMTIDHINGDKGDNRIINLRLASYSEQAANTLVRKTNAINTKWVSKRKYRDLYQGSVWFGKTRKQRYFKTKEEAYAWASATAKQLHGPFFNAG
jgi:hypothetical protein